MNVCRRRLLKSSGGSTDGFYEWENPDGEEFGLRRLESVVLESHDCSAEEVISRLRFAFEDFCQGTEQKDELTAVILKCKAVSVPVENGVDDQIRLAAHSAVA